MLEWLFAKSEISNLLLILVDYVLIVFLIKDFKRSEIGKAFIEELKKRG